MNAQRFTFLVTVLFASACTPSCGAGKHLFSQLARDSNAAREPEAADFALWQKNSLKQLGIEASYIVVLGAERSCTAAALLSPKLWPNQALQRPKPGGQEAEASNADTSDSQSFYAITLCPKIQSLAIFDGERKLLLKARVESEDLSIKDSTGKISQSQEYCSALKILRFNVSKFELKNNASLESALHTPPILAFKFPTSTSEKLFAVKSEPVQDALEVFTRELNWIQGPEEISSMRGAHGKSQVRAEFKTQSAIEELSRNVSLIYWAPPEGQARVLGISEESIAFKKQDGKGSIKGLRIVAFPDCINPVLDTLYAMQSNN